jgi:hypothetical protein
MTSKQFDAALKHLGLTREAAAEALGLSRRSVISHARRAAPVPRWLELAVKGLLAERGGAPPVRERPSARHARLA